VVMGRSPLKNCYSEWWGFTKWSGHRRCCLQ